MRCGSCALVIEEVELLLSQLDRPLLDIRLEQELVRGQHPSSACVGARGELGARRSPPRRKRYRQGQ
eukprot:scaffold22379_cov60-Phaeocystis_antarctica.AAC.7